jgi:protein-S-isoprenylcysteine O-methyltransferase Ste14
MAHSNPVIFPPLIPLGGFVLGVLCQWAVPLALPSTTVARAAGVVVLALGAAGFAWMVVTMKRARTPIHNNKTPTALVESGPFRWTRNPMYLFGSVGYCGLALLLLEPWSLALLPLVVAATHYGVILREEAFLEGHFGDAYKDYRAKVRRWL